MTTCREIVRAAFEEYGGVAQGEEPSAAEARFALVRLNALLAGLAGMGVGEPLADAAVSSSGTLEANRRAVVTGLAGPIVLTLPAAPQNGARVQLVDAEGAFAAKPVTLARNGRKLEGAASDLVCNTAGFSRTWMYRADLADWRRVETLTLADDFPYPAETEEAFTLLLALRLAPRDGMALSAESQAALRRGMSGLRARYRQRTAVRADEGVLRLSRQAFGRGC